MESVENRNVCFTLCDLVSTLKKRDLFVTLILSLGLCFLSGNSTLDFKQLIVGAFPNLIGFSIAAIAILYGYDNLVIKRLHKKINSRRPFDELAGSFTFSILLQLLTLILILPFSTLDWVCNYALKYICSFFFFFSLIWLIHLTLHLFTIRTYFKGIDETEKEK